MAIAKPITLLTTRNAEAGSLETLPSSPQMIIRFSGEPEKEGINFHTNDKVAITSEALIEELLALTEDPLRRVAIQTLKDKFRFRQVLQRLYPGYRFRKVHLDELARLHLDRKAVLKPVKGCFGTAVRILEAGQDLSRLAEELSLEIHRNSQVLSETVLSHSEFILEDFIEGPEYAVDAFYDQEGKARIVNIYYHPLPQHKEYLHMIYYTGRAVFDTVYAQAQDFLGQLNEELQVANLPLHAEFKREGDQLIPVEINPARFGGMGLGNLVYHALGVNPYECFARDEEPSWKTIWSSRPPEDRYVFLLPTTAAEWTRRYLNRIICG